MRTTRTRTRRTTLLQPPALPSSSPHAEAMTTTPRVLTRQAAETTAGAATTAADTDLAPGNIGRRGDDQLLGDDRGWRGTTAGGAARASTTST